MITDLHLINVQGLRKVEVTLRPLTVLVGANDTGKSTFLRALDAAAHRTSLAPTFGSAASVLKARLKKTGLL